MSVPGPSSPRRALFGRRAFLGGLGLATRVVTLPGPAAASDAEADEDAGRPVRPASAFDAAVPTAWFDLALRLVRDTPGFSPPVASRALAYAGLALYEAVVPGMPEHRSLAGQLDGLTAPRPPAEPAHHWPAVANGALATILRRLFPTASGAGLAAVAELEEVFAARLRPAARPAIDGRSVHRGRRIAEHVFAWSTTDGGHEGYLRNFPATYSPPVGPGLWVPTPAGFLPALQPFWGTNRPFALASGRECDPGPPTPYAEEPGSAFYREARRCYHAVNNLTPEQRAFVLFWADDPGTTATPPGHSLSILTQVLRRRRATLDVAAEAYARVGMAVADAFIACWSSKYRYNLLRPVTYVRRLIDPTWLPVLTTPPFPEHTSGHSVQSGAAAQVLTDLFGAVPFTDHTHDARGLAPRSFGSFFAAAEEAAVSRLSGGIHFRPAIERGLEQGTCVGRKVSALRFRR
jgi:hypothetical protein